MSTLGLKQNIFFANVGQPDHESAKYSKYQSSLRKNVLQLIKKKIRPISNEAVKHYPGNLGHHWPEFHLSSKKKSPPKYKFWKKKTFSH